MFYQPGFLCLVAFWAQLVSFLLSNFVEFMASVNDIMSSFQAVKEYQKTLFADEMYFKQVAQATQRFVISIQAGNKILAIGNGGSHCDAMHFAEELAGRFRENREPLAAIACTDPAFMSCVANDYGFEQVFARFVGALGKKNDVLLAISTSGNSPNILAACQKAREKGMEVIGLSSKKAPASFLEHCTLPVLAPANPYADRIQEVHIQTIHTWIEHIEKGLQVA